tara:strand:- start:10299 stop:10829 length:531 start_codon:yes stop_codon:yes gene_type:complete
MGIHLVAFGGPRGCGKSTIAEFLVQNHGYERIAFSDVLREIAVLAGTQYIDNRVYLSQLGEVIRRHDPQFLLNSVKEKILNSLSNIVIEDIRFQSELDFCDEYSMQTIYFTVPRNEQIRRVQEREGCSVIEAQDMISLRDEGLLSSDSGWNTIIQSEGDFRNIAEQIVKNASMIME